MSATVYIARSKEVAARMIGGEMIILSARTSRFFSLNEAASLIWQQADGMTQLAEIVEQHICTRFEVDSAVALSDAKALVDGLSLHGVLRVSNTAIEEPL